MNKKQDSKKKSLNTLSESELATIRQNSSYGEGNRAAPDNNLFFEERSNPLSSKGS